MDTYLRKIEVYLSRKTSMHMFVASILTGTPKLEVTEHILTKE